MSKAARKDNPTLPPSMAMRLEEICNRFEAAWKVAPCPRIEDFLGDAPETERSIFLQELIPLDAEYRRRHGENPRPDDYVDRFPDLETLWLGNALAAPTVVEEIERSTRGQWTTSTDSATLPVLPGYEILEELGRGGMGVVYKARQIRAHRLVAVKMILAGVHAGPGDLARFRTEAEAVARLQHPSIVQIHDVDEHNGLPFLSLEFCEGGGLAGQLDGTPWLPQKAARFMETLARAMQAAHQRHIIHRDLKPANVLLTAAGEPKISDFGLAKKLDEASGHTQSGAVMGTPSYMAPEQAEGKTKEVGASADVYALGAILYELLTGRPPFKGPTPLDTIMQVLEDKPVPPSMLNPGVPRDLEAVCLRCLEKDPRRRYPGAAELAEDLERFVAGELLFASAQRFRFRPLPGFARRWPFLSLALLFLLSNCAGSMFNIVFLSHGGAFSITEYHESSAIHRLDAQRHAYRQVNTGCNLVLYAMLLALFVHWRRPLARCRQELRAGQVVPPERLTACRRSVVNLPAYCAALSGSLWLVGAMVIPASICVLTGWEDAQRIWLHVGLSFVIPVLATTLPTFFLTEAFTVAFLYPDFFRGDAPDEAVGVVRIPLRWRDTLLWAGTAVPLLLVVIVLLSLNEVPRGQLRTVLFVFAVLGVGYSGLTFFVGNRFRRARRNKRLP